MDQATASAPFAVEVVDFRSTSAYQDSLQAQLTQLGNPAEKTYIVLNMAANAEGLTLPVVVVATPENYQALRHLMYVNQHTPSNHWQIMQEQDPHGTRYSLDRAELGHGWLSDDAFANELFLCDHRTSLSSIGFLDSAKQRIRFLSRKVDELLHILSHTQDKRTRALATKVQERNALRPIPERLRRQ